MKGLYLLLAMVLAVSLGGCLALEVYQRLGTDPEEAKADLVAREAELGVLQERLTQLQADLAGAETAEQAAALAGEIALIAAEAEAKIALVTDLQKTLKLQSQVKTGANIGLAVLAGLFPGLGAALTTWRRKVKAVREQVEQKVAVARNLVCFVEELAPNAAQRKAARKTQVADGVHGDVQAAREAEGLRSKA